MRDLDVRLAVRRRLNELHRGDLDTRIVEEMGVWAGSVRIDIAVINGELCGFELKSDRDTLERLPAQAAIYNRVFDRVELVVGQRHAAKAKALVPSWWGITIASESSGGVCLALERKGDVSPTRDAKLIAHLLWKDEAIEVLDLFGLAKGWRSKPVGLLHERLAYELPFDELRQAVRCKLKARVKWLGKPVAN